MYLRAITVVITLLIFQTAFGTSPNDLPPVKRYGQLQVIGKHLCDSAGNPIQLRGLSTHGIQYFPEFYTEELVKSLARDWNCDVLRVASYINEGQWNPHGTYLDNPTHWHEYIDEIVDWADKYDIYIIIDWHVLAPGDPNYFKDEAKEFWKYMTEKHGNKKHVIFEICNEPNDVGSWDGSIPDKVVTWPMIKEYADEIMQIIRKSASNVTLVGTPKWGSRPDHVINNPVEFSNIMYTAHFYAADHGESYREYIQTALDNEIPMFISEFGLQEASGYGPNDFQSSTEWLEFLNKNRISWINWNLSNDMRSSAIYKENFYEGYSYNEYSNTSNMKESGQWILKQLRTPVAHTSILNNKDVKRSESQYISNHVLRFGTVAPFSVELYSTNGRIIKQFFGNGATLDLKSSDLAQGVYLIRAIHDSRQFTIRFVVK